MKKLINIFLISCFLITSNFAAVDFASKSSYIELLNENSKVAYGSEAFTGWEYDSLVKVSGNDDLKALDANSDGAISYDELHTTGEGVILLDGITTPMSVPRRSFLASPVDLSGGLTLAADQNWSSGTTIVAGGWIDFQGNAIVLGGDIFLPDNFDIKIVSSGIIDGQGHNWIFGHNSKIRFDQYVTVTFRNLKLRKLRDHNDGNASISVMNPWRSQLALQNSDIFLDDEFSFTSGQMFIHGDVKIAGTSQFNYTTTKNSWITKASTFMFDTSTTLSYGPAVPSVDRDLIKMSDVTSQLYLNGATLKSTTTGLRLTKGTLVLDHRSYIYNQDDLNGEATSISQAVSFGDGSNGLNIQVLPGANIELKSGIIDYNN